MGNKKNESQEQDHVIIINKMYVGSYLSEGVNIGHEIINLYKADDGNNYIYLNPSGKIDKYRDDKITVLLTRKAGVRTYKILAKAEDVEIVYPNDELVSKTTYGNVPHIELFEDNTYNGGKDQEESSYITFRAGKVVKPKEQLFITDDKHRADNDKGIYHIGKKEKELEQGEKEDCFGRQSLREYFSKNQKQDFYKCLIDIIDGDLWEDTEATEKISEISEPQIDEHFNFLKIIRKEDYELAFSNMLAYFFDRYREIFLDFAKEVLHVEGLDKKFTVERENHHIDILISDKSNVIVIENKIKSGIIGENKKYKSQLEDYYNHVNNTYEKEEKHFFIFVPNLKNLDKNDYEDGDKYKEIKYKEIFDFYKKYIDKKTGTKFVDEPYCNEFVNSLYKHTLDYDDELEEEMRRRFLNAIYRKQQKNKKSSSETK